MKKLILAGLLSAMLIPTVQAASNDLLDGGSILIVAHNDDQTLFFDPIMRSQANKTILLAGPPDGVTRFNHPNTLKVHATSTIYGDKNLIPTFDLVSAQEWLANAYSKNHRDHNLADYYQTYAKVKAQVQQLQQQGIPVSRLVTHNMWGEYGHPNHRTVAAVVRTLGTDMNLDVWMDATSRPGDAVGLTYTEETGIPGVEYVSYSGSYGSAFTQARQLYQRSTVPYNDNSTGAPASTSPCSASNTENTRPYTFCDDAWTWHDGESEHPDSTQYFFKIVNTSLPKGQRDIFISNSATQQKILAIREAVPPFYGPDNADTEQARARTAQARAKGELSREEQKIANMYVVAGHRAPDNAGLMYWYSEYKRGVSLMQISAVLFNAYQSNYPASLSSEAFITKFYQDNLNATPDYEAVSYWANELNGLQQAYGFYQGRGEIAQRIVDASLGAPYSNASRKFLSNRLDFADYAVVKQSQQNLNDGALFFSTYPVTEDLNSVNAAKHLFDAYH